MEYKIWNGEKLKYNICIDTETDFVPFHTTADLITFQAFDNVDAYFVRLEDVKRFLDKHTNNVLIFHNCVFDLDVIGKFIGDIHWFHNHLEKDLLRDTMLLYKLYKLAVDGNVPFKTSLKNITKELFNIEVDKNEEIRNNFEEFKGKRIEDIPQEFLQYAILDTKYTMDVYNWLITRVNNIGHSRLSENIQIAGAIALNRIYKNGIGFNLKKASDMLEIINKDLNDYQDILSTYGWVRGQRGGKQRFNEIVKYLNLNVPRMEDGNFSTKAEDLAPFRDDYFIDTYSKFIELEKTSTFIRDIVAVHEDVDTDIIRLHNRYNPILNTGRTSCRADKKGFGCNFQQLPKKGGIRELFVAKEGHTFLITDYSAVELATLAQVMYIQHGHSTMRDLINEGKDLHRYAASVCFNKTEEDVTKDERQLMKCLNFGYGANMSFRTFVGYAAAAGHKISEEDSEILKKKWCTAYPEILKFWNTNNEEISITLTGRVRSKCRYTAYLNTKFQGLASDGAKIAMYYLQKEGFKIVGFCHDEIITEVPIDKAEELLKKQEEIMIEGMRQVTPDVKIGVGSEISKVYKK